MFKIKRIYEKAEESDGFRVLVDRLWPRGMTKERAKIDLWLKDIGPTTELRKWFGHDPARWVSFEIRYSNELSGKQDLMDKLLTLEKEHSAVTLLYAAKDTQHNEAVILAKNLNKK